MSEMSHRWFRICCSILLGILLITGASSAVAAEKIERVAKLSSVKGDVKVKKAGGAKPFKAFNNMGVSKGDQIFTGKDSSVQLLLDEGSKISIGSNSHGIISELTRKNGANKTNIKVVNGQVWSKVQSLTNTNDTFKFETPTAVMGIRGTMLYIKASEEQSGLWVTEGAVEVSQSDKPDHDAALVLSNERVSTSFSSMLGGKIDAKALVHSIDPALLRTVTNDIIQAVYDVANNSSSSGLGKGVSNEFLEQAREFVQEAKEVDPTIDVPESFDEVVEQVQETVSQHVANNPNPPGVTNTQNTSVTVSTSSPGSTGSGSGGSSGNNNSGGGNSGGGNGNGNGGGSEGEDDDDEVVVKSIQVAPGNGAIETGQTISFKATATMSNGTTKDVTNEASWSVANSNVASISSQGVATGLTSGSTTVQASYGGQTGSAGLTVKEPTVVSITVEPGSGRIETGQSLSFTASATMSNGTTKDVTNEASWSVVNRNVASISSQGVATGLASGSTTVQASYGGQTGSAGLTVKEPTVVSITVEPGSGSIQTGQTLSFTASATMSNGTTKNVTNDASWSTSNSNVANISSQGVATGVTSGSTTVQASYGGQTGSAGLTVTQPPAPSVLHISITPVQGTVGSGQLITYTATAHMSDRNTRNITTEAAWSIADPHVAGLNGPGLVIGLQAGVTTVKASYAGMNATAGLFVEEPVLVRVEILPVEAAVEIGETVTFSASAVFSDGSTSDVTSSANWNVDNPDLASITNPGAVEGVSPGSTFVTATYDGISGSASLTVTESGQTNVLEITVYPNERTLGIGQPYGFYAKALLSDQSIMEVTNSATWSVDNAQIAEIIANVAIGVAVGETAIRAEYGGNTAEVSIQVMADDGEEPLPPSDVTVQDNDNSGGGVDGRDFSISWTPSPSADVVDQEIYVIPDGDTVATMLYPVVIIQHNHVSSWTGSDHMIIDSLGDIITTGSYKIGIAAVDAYGLKSEIVYSAPITIVGEYQTVTGSVRENVTEAVLEDVLVKIYDGELLIGSDMTDSEGMFSITVPKGTGYRMKYYKAGYVTYEKTDVVLDEEQQVGLEPSWISNAELYQNDLGDLLIAGSEFPQGAYLTFKIPRVISATGSFKEIEFEFDGLKLDNVEENWTLMKQTPESNPQAVSSGVTIKQITNFNNITKSSIHIEIGEGVEMTSGTYILSSPQGITATADADTGTITATMTDSQQFHFNLDVPNV